MKLATLRDGTRDGALVVVRRDGAAIRRAARRGRTLQARARRLGGGGARRCARSPTRLDAGQDRRRAARRAPARTRRCRAPTSGWTARRTSTTCSWCARRAAPSRRRRSRRDPLVYQGGSGVLLGPTRGHPAARPGLGPRLRVRGLRRARRHARWAPRPPRRGRYVRLRHARERRARCATSSPTSWRRASASSRASPPPRSAPSRSRPTSSATRGATAASHLRVRSTLQRRAGRRHATPGPRCTSRSSICIAAHRARRAASPPARSSAAARCRNADRARGISCLAERRMIETIEEGKPTTPFMKPWATPSRSRCSTRDGHEPRSARISPDGGGRSRDEARLTATGARRRAWRVRIALGLKGAGLRVRRRATS